MPKKTYEVSFNDIKKGSADYRQVVEPLYREEAIKVIQSFFRHYKQYKDLSKKNSGRPDPNIKKKMDEARSKMVNNTIRMKKLQEPIDIRFATELASNIKNNRYDLINYAEPDFTRHLFAALRTGQISMNEMMTAKLMFESLTCFNKGNMPENPAECFSTFALDDENGPYRPEKEINHWTEAESLQLKEQITGNEQNNQYYTINLSHHQMIGFFYKKLVDLGSNQSNKFVSMLRDYFNASNIKFDDKRHALNSLQELKSGSESAVNHLKTVFQTYEPSVTNMMDHKIVDSNNTFGLGHDELQRELGSIKFLVTLNNVSCYVPSVCRSPQYDESNSDSPVLCFILPTIETFNTLQSVAHGKDSTIPTPVVGMETVRMIRAYDEIPALKIDDVELQHLSEAQHILKTLYPMTANIKSPSRPIEITHPDTKKTKTPHDYYCHDFLLSWHDLFHAWRNGSNYKPLIRKLRGLHDEKGGLAKDKSGMSENLWPLTDMDFSFGQLLRNHKSNNLELLLEKTELKVLIELLERGGFHFNEQLDDNYLFTYSWAKNPDEWKKLIDLTALSYYASDVPSAPEFFKQQQSTENYLRLHPDASITEVILNDLLQPKMEGDAALLDSLRSKGYKDIFYWSKNSGLFFEKSFTEKNSVMKSTRRRKLRSYSSNEIREILRDSVENIEAFEKNTASSLSINLPIKSRVLQPDQLKRAIMYAMVYEKPELFIDLLQGGNDLNISVPREIGSQVMVSPIKWSIELNHVELVRSLLSSSYKNNKDSLGQSFISFIDHFSYHFTDQTLEILKILTKHGVDINERNNNGETIIFKAVRETAQTDITQRLIDIGVKIDVVNDEGNSPLHCVRNPLAAEIIINAGGDVRAKNKDGKTPLEVILKDYDQYLNSRDPKDSRSLSNTISMLIDRVEHDFSFTSEGNEIICNILKKVSGNNKYMNDSCKQKLINRISVDSLSTVIEKNPFLFKEIITLDDTEKICAILKTIPNVEAQKLWMGLDETVLLNTVLANPTLSKVVPSEIIFKAVTNNDYNQGFSRLYIDACYDRERCVDMLLCLPEARQIDALLSENNSKQSVWRLVFENPVLLAAMPDNILIAVISDKIKSNIYWEDVLEYLQPEKCTILFRTLKDSIKNMLYPSDLKMRTMQVLSVENYH